MGLWLDRKPRDGVHKAKGGRQMGGGCGGLKGRQGLSMGVRRERQACVGSGYMRRG